MKKVVRRIFFDYEKEEAWLNEMAGQGWALVDYHWRRYVFVACEPGEYHFRLYLLEGLPITPDGAEFIEFLEAAGAECVASHFRWAYFRQRTEAGDFEICNDLESKIRHFKRVKNLWGCLFIMLMPQIYFAIRDYITWTQIEGKSSTTAFYFWWASILIVLSFLSICWLLKYLRKISRLKQKRMITE